MNTKNTDKKRKTDNVELSGTVVGGVKFGKDQYKSKGRSINTGGGTYISGSVNTGGGDFVGRDKNTVFERDGIIIGGKVSHSNIITGDDNVVDSIINMQQKHIQQIFDAIEFRPETDLLDKEDLKAAVDEIAKEDRKGENADESFIARRLRNIQRIAPDILDVVLATIADSAAGFGVIAKKVAEKMKGHSI